MVMSKAGLQVLKMAEGFRRHIYKDAAGLPTIGYGHRLLAEESFPEGISEDEASKLLSADLQWAEQSVLRMVKVALTQGQFDALVDFVYNLGVARLAESTLLHLLNAGDYEAAARQFLLWDKVNGCVSPALLRRRQAELTLWRSAN